MIVRTITCKNIFFNTKDTPGNLRLVLGQLHLPPNRWPRFPHNSLGFPEANLSLCQPFASTNSPQKYHLFLPPFDPTIPMPNCSPFQHVSYFSLCCGCCLLHIPTLPQISLNSFQFTSPFFNKPSELTLIPKKLKVVLLSWTR